MYASLKCAKGLHLYNGRCYRHCPDGTYASEITAERSSRRRNLTYFSESANAVSKREDGDDNKLTEALDMEHAAAATLTPVTCLPCHNICATCAGPNNNQCLTCLDHAQLVLPKFNCSPNSVPSQISDANWHYGFNVALPVILFVVSFISLYCFMSCIFKRYCGGHYNSKLGAYNKLAVDDQQQSALEVEEEIFKALKDYSESESDDDLNL
ncbi:Furin-like convetase [Operophtera brumata]|uniref:Furin-like convetase n=1 Tax=Operophtera brumata TaxID=104452 RepID=A0A0L7KY00_OPEBR|nr:Furin-like convetase [Operophtera brumata]